MNAGIIVVPPVIVHTGSASGHLSPAATVVMIVIVALTALTVAFVIVDGMAYTNTAKWARTWQRFVPWGLAGRAAKW